MIIRLTQKLAKKIKFLTLEYFEKPEDPILDWTSNIFNAGRSQYIIFTNSDSLFSLIFPSAGINNSKKFIEKLEIEINKILELYGLNSIPKKQLPGFSKILFTKTKDKSVLGSINEFVYQTKFYMINWKLDNVQATIKMNDLIMDKINYDKPIDRFR